MRVLITGATGFLGSHITRRLAGRGHIALLKRKSSDLRRLSDVLDRVTLYDVESTNIPLLLETESFDTIVHTATDYGRDSDSGRVLESNVLWPVRLARDAATAGVRRFITTDTYFNQPSGTLPESFEAYTLSKRHLNDWLRLLADRLSIINLKLFHLYGPGDAPTKFVNAMARRLLQGEHDIPATAGAQVRDFLYVDDAVSAFEAALRLDAGPGWREFETGSGTGVTIREFLEELARQAGVAPSFQFGALPYRRGEIMNAVADTRGLRALGWSPNIDLPQGLAAVIAAERRQLHGVSA